MPVVSAGKENETNTDQEQKCALGVAMIISAVDARATSTCIKALQKLLTNIVMYPHEDEYRHIRLSNETIQQHVLKHPSGLDALEAAGFVRVEEGEENVLCLPLGSTDQVTVPSGVHTVLDALNSAAQPTTTDDELHLAGAHAAHGLSRSSNTNPTGSISRNSYHP